MSSTLADLAIGANRRTVSAAIDALADVAGKQMRSRIVNALLNQSDTYCRRMYDLQFVRTLFSPNKTVSILDFYYKTRIRLQNASTSTSIDAIDELSSSRNYVIVGTAGQGKSVFMRYLCIQQIREMIDERLPIFVELRKANLSEGVQSIIREVFDQIGFGEKTSGWRLKPTLDEVIAFFFEAGRCVLFLDGFDEVPVLSQPTLARDLDRFARQYPNVQIIVASRPDTAICKSTLFDPIFIHPLHFQDVRPFMLGVVKDSHRTDLMIKALERSEKSVREVLSSPLLITLIIIVYLSTNKIPPSLFQFYNNIFDVLLYRHDATKQGFSRNRFVDLSETDITMLFYAMCFVARTREELSFDRVQWKKIVKSAETLTGIQADSDKMLDEVVRNLCLVYDEGSLYSFIHKSIVEFSAAKFVRESDEPFASAFYGAVTKDRYGSWQLELDFLADIDPRRYARLFWMPAFAQLESYIGIRLHRTTKSVIRARRQATSYRGGEATLAEPQTDNRELVIAVDWEEKTLRNYLRNINVNITVSKIDIETFEGNKKIYPTISKVETKNEYMILEKVLKLYFIDELITGLSDRLRTGVRLRLLIGKIELNREVRTKRDTDGLIYYELPGMTMLDVMRRIGDESAIESLCREAATPWIKEWDRWESVVRTEVQRVNMLESVKANLGGAGSKYERIRGPRSSPRTKPRALRKRAD